MAFSAVCTPYSSLQLSIVANGFSRSKIATPSPKLFDFYSRFF
jgi:hypothetical protein